MISYECPPDTSTGGIATYIGQAAAMLASRGNDVEIFTAASEMRLDVKGPNLKIHRIGNSDRSQFGLMIAPVFAARHSEKPFDVLEGPDFAAEAANALSSVPTIPFVLKLHMGMYLIRRVEASELSIKSRFRHWVGAMRRRQPPLWHARHPANALEVKHVLEADEVAAPCGDIAKLTTRLCGLNPAVVSRYPYPYEPSAELLTISPNTSSNIITFVGRLELRKGIIDLAAAIPTVLAQFPTARFRIVGRPLPSPMPNIDMRDYLRARLGGAASSVEFEDPIPLDQMAAVYAATDICVFPSLWENFPNVCLEAMAAARGIVASSAGGMAEQLAGGEAGIMIPPRKPSAIAAAIIELLRNPTRRIALGCRARERVLREYAPNRVGPLQEASYLRAIMRRAEKGSRHSIP